MTPGDLFRLLRWRLHPDADPLLLRVADASHDQTVPALWYGDDEIISWPRGEVPAHSIFCWVCTHPECAQAGHEPFRCHRGEPPAGIERRGLEFLQEPGDCGHRVQRRLVLRGSDAIVALVSDWRLPNGRRLLRAE